jgi:hypothetical protein
LTTNTFYDPRESEWVDATELDIGKMYDSGYAPRNGVIYFYDKIHGASNWPALRLTDASELDTGLTIASENPLYTMGDFNSIVKQPASIIADAITLLSGNWVDSISTEPTGSRNASNTTVNACLLTGNTETTPGVYNGGLENLPRLLEDWAGRTLTWTGSAVNLWYSQQATGNWSSAYYTDPIRAWQYDADLDVPANHPPQTPRVRFFLRLGWKQHDIFYNWAS